ncbi:Uncharacterised protein [Mycobacteroides abscessus subsp. abscessus]|nr:Uncharacterised protein [Mycobacteroides abscessus subsp. abscessus]
MRGPDPDVTGQGCQPVQRRVLCPRQFFGPVGGDQIGARGRPDDQRTPAEHADLPVAVEQQEHHVFVGVAGGEHGAQPEPTEVDLVAVVQAGVLELAVPSRRREDAGLTLGRELVCAGEEIGVQVRVGGEGDGQPAPGRDLVHGTQIAAHVDDERAPVTEIDEIGGVAQPLVDEGNEIDRHVRLPSPSYAPTCRPATTRGSRR